MNFTKYAAALALLSTAAFAAESDKGSTTPAVPAVDKAALIAAFKDCKADNATVKDKATLLTCLEGKKIVKAAAEKAAEHFDKPELEDAAAQTIADAVNTPPAAPAAQNNDNKTKSDGSWFDYVNNWYGYTAIGAVVVLASVGIYMVVGRKSEDADL